MQTGSILGISPTLLNGGFLPFAHHPHCERYNNHLIWFCGNPLCLGCCCLYSGLAAGLLGTLFTHWHCSDIVIWFAAHLPFALPTVLQPWIQHKAFKIVARFLLGIGMSSAIIKGLFFVHPPFSRIYLYSFLLFSLITGYKVLAYLRQRFTHDPCQDCPLGAYPTCEWNMPRLLADNPTFFPLQMASEVNQSNKNK